MSSFKNLPIYRREMLIKRLNEVMEKEFGINQKFINDFWETFMIGAEVKKRA